MNKTNGQGDDHFVDIPNHFSRIVEPVDEGSQVQAIIEGDYRRLKVLLET